MHSHFVSYLGIYSTEEDQIHNGATQHVVYPIMSISCLLMLWRLKEPGHQQAWYWPPKPEYSITSIKRVNPWIKLIQLDKSRTWYPDYRVTVCGVLRWVCTWCILMAVCCCWLRSMASSCVSASYCWGASSADGSTTAHGYEVRSHSIHSTCRGCGFLSAMPWHPYNLLWMLTHWRRRRKTSLISYASLKSSNKESSPLSSLALRDGELILQVFSLNLCYKLILHSSCEVGLRYRRKSTTEPHDDKSTLVQVMAWCHQAVSHYLCQCWPRFVVPYGVTRPQWVNGLVSKHYWAINWYMHVWFWYG